MFAEAGKSGNWHIPTHRSRVLNVRSSRGTADMTWRSRQLGRLFDCSIASHAAVGCAGAFATHLLSAGNMGVLPSFAQAPGQRTTELFNQVMDDVLGRLTVRLAERDPGNGSAADRHPGSHTVGYIIEGTYEVKINDGPARTLKPGEVSYEPPNALHAISRNASTTQPLKYLVIQVSDPTKHATVPE
jgi:quercetin dioxygenase-like cupin family protein